MSATASLMIPRSLMTPAHGVASATYTSLAPLERALADGLHAEWRALVEQDPLASLFQTPGWCMPWYRCYGDAYAPFVVTVRDGNTLVGLVPMAVERSSGRLTFASNSMADYRDVVALPGSRKPVIEHLFDAYLAGGFSHPLPIGFLDPASDTPALVEEICRTRDLRFIVRHQPCYRWFPPPPKKPSAQKFLNWFKRQGEVTFDLVESEAEWLRFREEYYRQHSLRQIQAGRPTAFDDPRHREFYDAIFRSPEVNAHVTAFRLNGRTLAGHFGYVWRGVLLLGPPTIDLEHEQRSPSVILLSWIIQNAERLALSGFDLTIGDSDFKKRLGNTCVSVTQIDVYPTRRAARVDLAKREAAAIVKAVVAAVAGPDAWRDGVKPALARLRSTGRALAQLDAATAAGVGLATVVNLVQEDRTGLVLSITRDDLRPAAETPPPSLDVRENRIEDLLLCDDSSPHTVRALTGCARSYARLRAGNGTLHTLVVDGRLTAWACSSVPAQPVGLPEIPGTAVDLDPHTVWIHNLHVGAGAENGWREHLLRAVLAKRFTDGAVRAATSVLEVDRLARRDLEAVGFRVVQRQRYERVFTRERLTVEPAAVAAATEFQSYLAEEWMLFARDETRQREARRAVEGRKVVRVLDVGCGGGQDLIPFATPGTTCVGVDVSHESGVWATRQFGAHYPDVNVQFITSAAEYLPFADGFFDVVLCRVAIPYTDNRRALAEMSRVMRPGAALVLKTHTPRYYVRKLVDGVRRRSPLFSVHALRVLVTGSVYHATGRQPHNGLLLRETFQTRWLLERELRPLGLRIDGELADSNPLTRSYRITKRT